MAQNSKEIGRHIVRTIAITFAAAVVFVGVFLVMLALRLNVYVIFAVVGLMIAAIVYGTARWHPWWAPIEKRVARIPWQRADATEMETVVELAQIQAGNSVTEVYRISIYETATRHRTHRRLIGQQAQFLGIFQSGIWFYISDRFYSRRDGLVCVDPKSGRWLQHWPLRMVEFVDEVDDQLGLIDVIWNGVPTKFDLTRGARVS